MTSPRKRLIIVLLSVMIVAFFLLYEPITELEIASNEIGIIFVILGAIIAAVAFIANITQILQYLRDSQKSNDSQAGNSELLTYSSKLSTLEVADGLYSVNIQLEINLKQEITDRITRLENKVTASSTSSFNSADQLAVTKYEREIQELRTRHIDTQVKLVQQLMGSSKLNEAIVILEELLKETQSAIVFKALGTCYFELGNWDNAISIFSNAIKATPDDPELFFNRAVAKERAQSYQIESIIHDYNTAIELKQDYFQAFNNRGVANAIQGKLDDSIRDFSSAISIDNTFDLPLTNRARAKLIRGRYDDALSDINLVIVRNPGNSVAHKIKAQVLIEKQNFQEALDHVNTAMLLGSKSAVSHNIRGTIYAKMDKLELARNEFERAIRFDDNNIDARINLANLSVLAGDYEAALTEFNAAIEIDPTSPIAYTNRASIYVSTGRLDEAISDCNRVFELNSDFSQAYVIRAQAYILAGNLDAAINDCHTAISKNPGLLEPHMLLGNIYLNLKQPKVAYSVYNELVTQNPDNYDAVIQRGMTRSFLEDWEGMFHDYAKAIEIAPEKPKAYFLRHMAYLLFGNFRKAIDDVESVLTLEQEHSEIRAQAYASRAKCHYNLRDYSLALADISEAITCDPDNAEYYQLRSTLRAEMKDSVGAAADFKKHLELLKKRNSANP